MMCRMFWAELRVPRCVVVLSYTHCMELSGFVRNRFYGLSTFPGCRARWSTPVGFAWMTGRSVKKLVLRKEHGQARRSK
jgi:hypothetical protein